MNSKDIKRKVFESVGEASTCWSDPAGAGVYDATRAVSIADTLLADVEKYGYE